MAPVHKIGADRVMPSSTSDAPVEERVVKPTIVTRSAWITKKPGLRQQMELRPERIVAQLLS
jgi:hypothetical protein